jgi:hypothetical protein
MSFKIEASTFRTFLNLCKVKGQSAEGKAETYYETALVKVKPEQLQCLNMHTNIQYIDVTAAIEMITEGQMAFNIDFMQSAIKDLEGKEFEIKPVGKDLRVHDGSEYTDVPRLDESDDANQGAKNARAFNPRIAWDNDNFYFCIPGKTKDDEEIEIIYDNVMTLKAEDLLAKMSRLSFLKSIYYHLYVNEDSRLVVEVINAKKGHTDKKFRFVPTTSIKGNFDVEFLDALHPVINTIGDGDISICNVNGRSDIPCIVFHMTEKVQGIYIVCSRAAIEESRKKSKTDKKEEKPPAKKEEKKEEPAEDKKSKKEVKKGKKKEEDESEDEEVPAEGDDLTDDSQEETTKSSSFYMTCWRDSKQS